MSSRASRRRRRANVDGDAYHRHTNNESAAIVEEESSDEHAAADLTSILFKAIKTKCEHGTDDWAVVPFQDMQAERNISEYGNYVNSDRVLSKWIGVDGNSFQQCLFGEKSRKTSREAYLKEEFGLTAVRVRSKLTLIYFGKGNPTFDSFDLLLGQPLFIAGPVKTAKNALARQECKLTKEIVHNFIRDLKESSRDARALQICEAMMDLDQETIKSFATHATSLTNEVAVGISSTSTAYEDCNDVVPLLDEAGRSGQSTCDRREVGEGEGAAASSAAIVAPDDVVVGSLRVDTKKAPQSTPLVSPGVDDSKLIKAIKTLYPRNGKKTVGTLRENPKDSLTSWGANEEKRVKHLAKEYRDVKSVLHAASGGNVGNAAGIMCSMIKNDAKLATATFDELGKKGLEKIKSDALETYKDSESNICEVMANSMNAFRAAIISPGSRFREEQQAQDAVHVAALYDVKNDEMISKVAARLKMTRPAKNKALKRIKNMKAMKAGASSKRVQIYRHHQRALRCDSKAAAAYPFVYQYCHANDYFRAAREDTGEYRRVKVYNPLLHQSESHPVRRIEEHSNSFRQLFRNWEKSEYAKNFRKKYPHLKSIGFKLFRKLLCPCCKFSTHQMCADEAMSGLEEARSALQRACTTKYYKGAIKSCSCEFHSSNQNDILLRRAEEIIEESLCKAVRRPTLKRMPYPGFEESESNSRVPELHSFDCINGKCESCGAKPLLALIKKCPLLCPEVTEEDDDVEEDEGSNLEEGGGGGDDDRDMPLDVESDNEDDDQDEEESSGEEECRGGDNDEPTYDGINGGETNRNGDEVCTGQDDSGPDAGDDAEFLEDGGNTPNATECDWKDVVNGGCVCSSSVLGTVCGICKGVTHHLCHLNYARNMGKEEEHVLCRCSNCYSPAVVRCVSINEELADETSSNTSEQENIEVEEGDDTGCDDGISSDATEEEEERIPESVLRRQRLKAKFSVKLWKKVNIDRTKRTQKELVQQKMTIVELLHHFEECLEKARKHYGRYKVVDWNLDMIKYNTKSDHSRLVMYADYSASAKLRARRVLNSSIDTHAVIEPFIVYEYKRVITKNDEGEEVAKEECKKRSHIFIGSAETAGKKNDWQFHIACLKHLIRRYQRRRDSNEPIEEVITITDRCPTQYLCRQNFLQLAMASKEDNFPTLKHYFTCVSRGKGDHDAEGKVVKEGIARLVLGGWEGTTAWDFYCASKTEVAKEVMNEENEINHLHQRTISYVVYDEEEFCKRNQGEHEGNIVLANMNIKEDTDPLHSTTSIYGAVALPDYVLRSYDEIVDFRVIRNALYELEHKETDRQNDEVFVDGYDENEAAPSERARFDFIEIEKQSSTLGDLELFENAIAGESAEFVSEYAAEFVRRCGKKSASPVKGTNVRWVKDWLRAHPIERIYKYRTREHLVELHRAIFPSAAKTPNKKTEIVGEILGFDLPKPPARIKSAEAHYKIFNIDKMKRVFPDKDETDIDFILSSNFQLLEEDERYPWDMLEDEDRARYHDEIKRMWTVDEDDNNLYMRVDQLPCGCEKCLSNEPESCVSPYKKDMRPRLVQLKVKEKSSDGESNVGQESRE